MIDYQARARYAQRNSDNPSTNLFHQAEKFLKVKEENQEILKELSKKDEDIAFFFNKLATAISLIYRSLPKVNLPKIFQVKGQVEVTNIKDVKMEVQMPKEFPTNFVVDNLFEMEEYLKPLKEQITQLTLAISKIPPAQVKVPEIKIPKFEFPKNMGGNPELLSAINDLNETLSHLPSTGGEVNMSQTNKLLAQLVERPAYIPTPVTNITLNALQGFVKTTSSTVGTTAIELPNYGQLFNRRALQIYNNSSNTIYYGGSDVTVNNGIPIAAGSFSSAIDAGYNMAVFGIAATTGNNVRCLEVSKDQTANVQE